MIPAAFEYERAGSVEEALALLSRLGPDAKVLAGGHSLLPIMKLRLAVPSVLVDIGRLSELSYVHASGEELRIGALTRHCDLAAAALVVNGAPLLSAAAAQVGDPQVRHRGTIGGSLVHGDPASDLAAVVLAHGGELVLRSLAGERVVTAADFFRGFLDVDIASDELLVEIRVPRSTGGWAFEKFHRRAQDWAIVGVAVANTSEGVGVGLINMGASPTRARQTETALGGGASVAHAAALADADSSPVDDTNASAEYRRHLAHVLTRRALETAGY